MLRRQLAQNVERGVKPRRINHATRVSLALFARLFDWRDSVMYVRPSTIVCWHRLGWQIFWRLKCRLGRPAVPAELRILIHRHLTHGRERIFARHLDDSIRSLGLEILKLPVASPKAMRCVIG
jgi:putative transposase